LSAVESKMIRTPLFAVLVVLFLVPSVRAEDWPQWRGPTRDGAWTEHGVLKAFPREGLKIRWRRPVGPGFSSPIVAQGRVFLTDVDLYGLKTQERIACFDATSGKPLWIYSYDADYGRPDPKLTTGGPVPTPIYDAGKVYSIGKTELICLDAEGAKLRWKKSLEKEYQAQPSLTYASPLIEGNLLVIYAGRFSGDATECLIAIDKDSGKTAWRALKDYAAMSSPIVVSAASKRQLIVWSQQAVTSFDPPTGHVWWREATRPVNQSSAVATPVVQGGRLLIGGLMMKLDEAKPAAVVLWPTSPAPSRRNYSMTSSPMLQSDYVYSARTTGHFVCISAATGKELWRTDKVTNLTSGACIHLTPNGDQTFLYTDRGDLILANLGGKGYEEKCRAHVLEPTYPYEGLKFAWAAPAYADRCIFARSDKELVCASLAQ
jgi:outer membrane protein assembly factor BamB